MDVDEVVDTSDIDEQEVLDISDAYYWTLSCPPKGLYGDRAGPSHCIPHDGQDGISRGFPLRVVDFDACSPSPRKRPKISHDSATPETSVNSGINSSQIPPHAIEVTSPLVVTGSQTAGDGQTQSLTRNMDYDQTPPGGRVGRLSSPPHLLHSTLLQERPVLTSQPSFSSSATRPPESPRSSRSRSMSSEPWSLFSSPRCRPSTPLATSSQGLFGSPISKSGSPARRTAVQLSPLTPMSSSPRRPSRSPSPDELQLLPNSRRPSTMQVCSPRPDTVAEDSGPPIIPEDTEHQSVRYSLRRRDPRQLNPYAYDKLMYKRQMRSNPDAIVKFLSPKKKSHGHQEHYEEDTQAEYAFPLDNPDDDGDYVGSIPNRQSASVGTQEAEGASIERDTGWLPESLRPLSSSDEDDTDIRKLAANARRERERAAAKAKAEAKRRKAQLQTGKAAARQKPFPIPSLPADATPQSSQSRPPSDPHAPRQLRVRSEPLSSPVRPRQRPTPSSRASSHSPVLGSHGSPSSTLNYDYQQDDHFQHFNDFEEPFERDPSPGLIPAFDPPSSSSLGETDPPFPIPSHKAPSDVDSGSSSILELTAKERKRLRALRRMMPAAMISRHLNEAKQPCATSRRARAESLSSSDSEAKEVPLIPGLARVRRSTAYRNMDIRGDPESSDVEWPDDEVLNSYVDGHREENFPEIRSTLGVTPQPSFIDDEVISLSDDFESPSIESNSCSDGESDAGERWADGQLGNHERGPAREKSLIDWMLTRSRGSSVKKLKSRKMRTSDKSNARGTPRMDIVTSGAKGHRQKQKSLLSFLKPATPKVPSSKKNGSRDCSKELLPVPADGADLRKQKKKHRGVAQGLLYNFHRGGVRITSKHCEPRLKRGPVGLVIEDDDNDFYQALDPSWKTEIERWNKPTSSRQPVTRPSNPQGPHQPRHALPLQANYAPFTFDRKSPSPLPTRRHIVPDMDIHPLRPGVKFSSSSYLGKGMLYQLISVITGELEPAPPQSCDTQTFVIGPSTSTREFSAILGPLYDRIAEALRNPDLSDAEKVKDWELVFRVSCQLLSWLGPRAEDEEFETLETAIKEYSNGFLSCLGGLQPNPFSLAVHWFLLELASRLAASIKHRRGLFPRDDIDKFSERLLGHILDIDLEVARTSFREIEKDIETVELPHRAAELWICLIHLLNACDNASGTMAHGSPRHSLWRLIMELHPESSPTGAEVSEQMWRIMFNLCSLSQFSLHGLSTSVFRLPAAWDLVAVALKKIVLTANPEKEGQLPPRALRKRDDYLTCIVSRCFLLWSQWHWCLSEAMPMFKTLQEIFRSRNFVNLRNERSTYMGFLEHGNLELLSRSDHHDSVFEIFLKMVVQAVYSLNASDADSRQKTWNTKKLLQIAVPVSPVPFSKTVPPTNHELSMLLNRFSAMAVAIHLDPTVPNVRFRISQARRCVNFKDADEASRVACIYGMMYFARIMRHHRLPLDEALGWLTELANILMDDYKEAEASQRDGLSNLAKRNAITLIQLLLGSVRKIVETESLDKEVRSEYPDPALLDGPWITRVFNPGTNLVMLSQTGLEIRMLVQSFLNARTKALPPAQPQPPPATADTMNAESQEEYEKLYLELDDAELLAALGEEPVALAVNDLKAKDDALCKVLDKSITPAVYRLVCKHLGDSENAQVHENRMNVADEWIECWVGCANVLIQNGNKDWSLYMKLGQQSWEKIIDSSWRRRVGLRFNLSLLRQDPAAYPKYQDDFINVLLISSVSSVLSIEHEYASVVFTLDRLQHPLLRGAPFDPVGHGRRFEIGEVEYQEKRVQLLDAILKNAAERVRAGISVESEVYVGFLVSMFLAMRDIYQTDTPGKIQESYVDFCRSVYRSLLSHNELASHRRLSEAIDWGQTELRRDVDT